MTVDGQPQSKPEEFRSRTRPNPNRSTSSHQDVTSLDNGGRGEIISPNPPIRNKFSDSCEHVSSTLIDDADMKSNIDPFPTPQKKLELYMGNKRFSSLSFNPKNMDPLTRSSSEEHFKAWMDPISPSQSELSLVSGASTERMFDVRRSFLINTRKARMQAESEYEEAAARLAKLNSETRRASTMATAATHKAAELARAHSAREHREQQRARAAAAADRAAREAAAVQLDRQLALRDAVRESHLRLLLARRNDAACAREATARRQEQRARGDDAARRALGAHAALALGSAREAARRSRAELTLGRTEDACAAYLGRAAREDAARRDRLRAARDAEERQRAALDRLTREQAREAAAASSLLDAAR